ncbi:MAG: regulatory iron-sulfur-containing complex subunit RicT [Candidatus Falkowbacteria bacterium]|nr:regulatory iron-sulfur-containing complex subunit RicT [Candidatus Falkowbacteria bacterium]
MRIAEVQFVSWDKIYNFSTEEDSFKVGDQVLVATELGREIGKIVGFVKETGKGEELKEIIRRAEKSELNRLPSEEKKRESLEVCREIANRQNLDMKLVDVHFSFEGNRLNFAFIADGRVDFRELVKELTAHFNANIRLTQIGARDEARLTGDCGGCGKKLCCRGSVKEFSSVTSEMAEVQQVVHRGSDRISGMCGRLMCCLAYEYEGYKELRGKMPAYGAKVNVDGRRGIVVGHHVLKQSVDVRFPAEKSGERDAVMEVDLNRKNKKK